MTPRHTVPECLAGAPFRGSRAVQQRLVTKNQLRGPAYVRVLPDVYVRRGLELDPRVRISALRLHVDGRGVAVGLTAAWVHGAWRPEPRRALPLEFVCPPRRLGANP